jgi:acyl carrier protein
MPPLRGVVHAAGTLDDGVLVQQSWGRFERVMAAKVAGAWNLHELTAALPLDFFVLFSSAASVLGSFGQANHAAANAFEDALAHARRIDGLPAISINWGAWSELGSALGKEAQTRHALLGLGSMTPREGIATFERILSANPRQMAAAPIDWERFVEHYPRGAVPSWLRAAVHPAKSATRPERRESETGLRPRLEAAPETSRIDILREHVTALACRVLGFPPGKRIDPAQPLNELGLDSLMAVEYRNALAAAIEKPLPATLLFSYPAITDLTTFLMNELFPRAVEEAADSGNLLERIEDLSDDDVDRLLAQRTERGL